jgi:DUF4097 and DUF4098 domain-containing protein YvlB
MKMDKIWIIIIFAILIALTCLICLTSCTSQNHSKEFVKNTYELTSDFKQIKIATHKTDIIFKPSTDGNASVVCYERSNAEHTVISHNDTLSIEQTDKRSWYQKLFDISLKAPSVTIYLPNSEYTSLLIETDTGNIDIPNDFTFTETINIKGSTGNVKCNASAVETVKIDISTGELVIENASAKKYELEISTGYTNLYRVECESLVSVGSTGDITTDNITATGNIKIERDTGDITVKNMTAKQCELIVTTGRVAISNLTCESLTSIGDTGSMTATGIEAAENISITRSTGDVLLNNATCKDLISVASTGKLTMENVIAADKFSIERTTGDVEFKDCDAEELYIHTSTGRVNGNLLSAKIFITESSTGKIDVPKSTSGGACEITTSTGNIKITIG